MKKEFVEFEDNLPAPSDKSPSKLKRLYKRWRAVVDANPIFFKCLKYTALIAAVVAIIVTLAVLTPYVVSSFGISVIALAIVSGIYRALSDTLTRTAMEGFQKKKDKAHAVPKKTSNATSNLQRAHSADPLMDKTRQKRNIYRGRPKSEAYISGLGTSAAFFNDDAETHVSNRFSRKAASFHVDSIRGESSNNTANTAPVA